MIIIAPYKFIAMRQARLWFDLGDGRVDDSAPLVHRFGVPG